MFVWRGPIQIAENRRKSELQADLRGSLILPRTVKSSCAGYREKSPIQRRGTLADSLELAWSTMPKPDPVFQGPDNQDELTNAAMHTIPFEFASTDQAREAAGPDGR